MAADHDATRREIRVVHAKPGTSAHERREIPIAYAERGTSTQEPLHAAGNATSARPRPSSNAEAATRYRARQRGEQAPKRKPGPKPTEQTDLRFQNRKLQSRIAELELHLRIARQRLDRRTLTVEQAARDLLEVLGRDNPAGDSPERQVLLRDLLVEIEDRHEQWRD